MIDYKNQDFTEISREVTEGKGVDVILDHIGGPYLGATMYLPDGDKYSTRKKEALANLIVTTGDPLEITTEVRHLFIQGKEVSTDNKQQRLYEKYSARP